MRWAVGLLKTKWTRALSWSGIDVIFLGKGFEWAGVCIYQNLSKLCPRFVHFSSAPKTLNIFWTLVNNMHAEVLRRWSKLRSTALFEIYQKVKEDWLTNESPESHFTWAAGKKSSHKTHFFRNIHLQGQEGCENNTIDSFSWIVVTSDVFFFLEG